MSDPLDIVLSIETLNAFEQPRQAELLTQELGVMSSHLEDTPDYTQEEELLVQGFEGEFHTTDLPKNKEWWQGTIADLSEEFPDLVLSVNVYEDGIEGDHRDSPPLRREYYQDGKRQTVLPQLIIPDFDPEGPFD